MLAVADISLVGLFVSLPAASACHHLPVASYNNLHRGLPAAARANIGFALHKPDKPKDVNIDVQ